MADTRDRDIRDRDIRDRDTRDRDTKVRDTKVKEAEEAEAVVARLNSSRIAEAGSTTIGMPLHLRTRPHLGHHLELRRHLGWRKWPSLQARESRVREKEIGGCVLVIPATWSLKDGS